MKNPFTNLKDYKSLLEDPDFQSIIDDVSIADLVENWDDFSRPEVLKIFSALDIERKVDLINYLSPNNQEALIQAISEENARMILDEMEPDDLVDFIQGVSPGIRESIWKHLSEEARQEAQFLLKFDEDDAAGLMTPHYMAIRSSLTVAQALNWVRRNARDVETVYYMYVVDTMKRLMGVISLRELLISKDTEFIEDLMTKNVVSVKVDTDQEEVAKVLESYGFIALPVVDSYNRLLGIVTVDDVIDVIREEQTEDIYKMGAMNGNIERYLETSIFGLVKKRVPWLGILLLAATFTTNVLAHFEQMFTLSVLVLFIPTIIGTGGNSGTQSATLMIRGLATGEIRLNDFWRIILRELVVGFIIGLCMAILVIGRSLLLPPDIDLKPAIAVGISLGLVIVVATLVGATMPLLIRRLGFDPTVMAGPFMATIIDLSGLTIYFLTAKLILNI